jgi:transposase-like protein
MTQATDLLCPRCKSRYKVVRVRAEPELRSIPVHCRVCKESFAATDGDSVLKYFLIDKSKKRNGVDLRMKHAHARPAAQPSPVQDRPAVQQQHQVQPRNDDKK